MDLNEDIWFIPFMNQWELNAVHLILPSSPSFILFYFFLALSISPPLLVLICIPFFLILFPSLLPHIFLCPVFQSLLGTPCPLTRWHSESPTELCSPLLLTIITFVKHLRWFKHRLEPLFHLRQIFIAYSYKISSEVLCPEIQKGAKRGWGKTQSKFLKSTTQPLSVTLSL